MSIAWHCQYDNLNGDVSQQMMDGKVSWEAVVCQMYTQSDPTIKTNDLHFFLHNGCVWSSEEDICLEQHVSSWNIIFFQISLCHSQSNVYDGCLLFMWYMFEVGCCVVFIGKGVLHSRQC